MKYARIIVALAVSLTAALTVGLTSHHQAVYNSTRVRLKEGLSTNWSGYADLTDLKNPTNNSVTDVKGQWTVPNLTCTSQNTYSAAWVGIDGYSDSTVQQTGTEQDCQNGKPAYSAWFEMFPHWPIRIGLPIHAGDNISGEVSYRGHNLYDIYLQNLTTGRKYHTIQYMRAERQSAEWIVEAPSSIFGVLPLANFGTVNMSNASATINGTTGAINKPSWQNDAITMVSNDGSVTKAQPSALSSDGQSFSVNWLSN